MFNILNPLEWATYCNRPTITIGRLLQSAGHYNRPTITIGRPLQSADHYNRPTIAIGRPLQSADHYNRPTIAIGRLLQSADYYNQPTIAIGRPLQSADYYNRPTITIGRPLQSADHCNQPTIAIRQQQIYLVGTGLKSYIVRRHRTYKSNRWVLSPEGAHRFIFGYLNRLSVLVQSFLRRKQECSAKKIFSSGKVACVFRFDLWENKIQLPQWFPSLALPGDLH